MQWNLVGCIYLPINALPHVISMGSNRDPAIWLKGVHQQIRDFEVDPGETHKNDPPMNISV